LSDQRKYGDESLTISLEVARAEQVRASRVLMHSLASTWVAYALFGLMSLAVSALYVLSVRRGVPMPLPMVLLFGGGPLFVIALIYGSPSYTVWHLRRQMPLALGPATWTFSRTGLSIAGPHSTVSVEWCLVMQVRECRDFWLFRITKLTAYGLPRRALDEAAEASLRASLQQWIGSRLILGQKVP
jgi:hypothetical protein